MSIKIIESMEQYVEAHFEETLNLFKEFAVIPAPTLHEEQRTQFCKEWLENQGAEGVYIDEVGNTVYPYQCDGAEEIVAFMAHCDVIPKSMEPLPLKETDGRIYIPGAGDNTASVVNLLMVAKYVTEKKLKSKMGILFVVTIGEEGGGFVGSKHICNKFKSRLREVIAFDVNTNRIIMDTLPANNYRITTTAQGGHAYTDFGGRSAIYDLAQVINKLYKNQPPQDKAKTTYNVGVIEGGTAINAIATQASMLYEHRSTKGECLLEMEEVFHNTIKKCRDELGIQVEVKLLDSKPVSRGVDPVKHQELIKRNSDIWVKYFQQELIPMPGSTDSSIPLSLGIPAITLGTIIGEGAHSPDEWIESKSFIPGQKVAMSSVLHYLDV